MPATKSTIPRPDAETLRRLYIAEERGCPEIARRYERDEKTVYWWLKQAGIPTRARGSDVRQHFKKGHTASRGRQLSAETKRKIGAKAMGRNPWKNRPHWLKDQPPERNPRWLGGGTAERQDFYRSREWKAACKAVWKRADAKCERCGHDHRDRDRRTEREFHVHHIVSFAVKEMRAEPSNLALLCWPCHRFVHSKENAAREFLPVLDAEKDAA